MVKFPSNGNQARGYLSTPPHAQGRVIVVQEWWD